MRSSRIAVLVGVVLVLAGCRGHEAITGGYGAEGVSGVVTMAVGMSNSSPAGVRVGGGRDGHVGGPRHRWAVLLFRRS